MQRKYLRMPFSYEALAEEATFRHVAEEAEKIVLGTLIDTPSTLNRIERHIRPTMFYRYKHLAGILFQMAKEGAIMRPAEVRQRAKAEGVDISEQDFAALSYFYEDDTFLDEVCRQVADAYHVREKFRAVLNVVHSFTQESDLIDPLKQMEKAVADVNAVIETETGNRYDNSDLVEALILKVDQIHKGERLIGHRTPFNRLNKSIGGWEEGTLVIVGAGSGAGKSTLALQFLQYLSGLDTPTAYISIEMSKEHAFRKIVPMLAGVSEPNLKAGKMTQQELSTVKTAIRQIGKIPLTILDDVSYVEDIEKEVAFLSRKKGVKLLAIDHIGIIKTRAFGVRDFDMPNFIAYELKRMAKQYSVCIIVLSQLNREAMKETGKEPQLSDLRNGGEPAADVVLMPQVLTDLNFFENNGFSVVHLHPVKRRDGGRGVSIPLCFIGKYASFFEGEPESPEIQSLINDTPAATPDQNRIVRRATEKDLSMLDDLPF